MLIWAWVERIGGELEGTANRSDQTNIKALGEGCHGTLQTGLNQSRAYSSFVLVPTTP